MTTCPDCGGHGSSHAIVCGTRQGQHFCDTRPLNCGFCSGTGEVTEEQAKMKAEGMRLRDDRKARGLSGKQEAVRLGVSPVDWNHVEHGRKKLTDVLPRRS
jgi:ribosome-binding protein aMBF1 (putative translation factor)